MFSRFHVIVSFIIPRSAQLRCSGGTQTPSKILVEAWFLGHKYSNSCYFSGNCHCACPRWSHKILLCWSWHPRQKDLTLLEYCNYCCKSKIKNKTKTSWVLDEYTLFHCLCKGRPYTSAGLDCRMQCRKLICISLTLIEYFCLELFALLLEVLRDMLYINGPVLYHHSTRIEHYTLFCETLALHSRPVWALG